MIKYSLVGQAMSCLIGSKGVLGLEVLCLYLTCYLRAEVCSSLLKY